ncbi:family 1 encapsulin nanocompartment shell protein [Rarobacter incanus]|uniref:Type 1 encapsulin shell protein n=1 Tax=Rarobacter incanus TaxID=153494 RepID=A0A542SPA5_9MICO|nr:family 1 encapsulin nanocompartment shell protein [Rarobacter incanus]TQK76451.1 putative linocin/CFP29 family protein [Rarobacter incanus]
MTDQGSNLETPTVGASNLHRWLAPITDLAWQQIAEEAQRTFTRNVAGRRIVDVVGPVGQDEAARSTGHLRGIEPPAAGITSRLRQVAPLVELRVPFTVTREAVDDVLRGANDSDWQPVKDAAALLARAEDKAIFEGYSQAQIRGIRAGSSNAPVKLPQDPRDLPDTVAKALTVLRLAGVDGPYALVLDADLYTEVSETRDHGYPIRELLERLVERVVWAPAITGGYLVTTRGGDLELTLGQDVSIGYLAHTATEIELYLQESFTFLDYTSEASVVLER